MAPPVSNLVQSQIDSALRSFLVSVAPGIEIVRGQDNRVGQPRGGDHIVFWPLRRPRLATNIDTFGNPPDPFDDELTITTKTEIVYQLDVHGPNATDNAEAIRLLFRDPYGIDKIATANALVTPLYCDEPKQVPFYNAEQQIEFRWIVEAHLQADPTLSFSQESAIELKVKLVEADIDPINFNYIWAAVDTPVLPDGGFADIAYSPTLRRLVVVFYSNTGQDAMWSDDGGRTWTLATTPTTVGDFPTWQSVKWVPFLNRYVAIGQNTNSGPDQTGRLMTSTDGKIWSMGTPPPTLGFVADFAFSDTMLMVAGTDTSSGKPNAVYTTTNLTSWTAHTNLPGLFGPRGIAYNPNTGNFLVFEEDAFAYVTVNGSAWSVIDTGTSETFGAMWDAAYGGGIICAVGVSGSPAASVTADDINWSPQPTPNDAIFPSFTGIDYLPGQGFAAVSDAQIGFDAMRSPNGLAPWTSDPTPNDGQDWWRVAAAPDFGVWVAISQNNTGKDVMIFPTRSQ